MTPQIDFYVLADASESSRLQTACRLSAKAWQQQYWVFIRCQNQEQYQQLDDALWHHRPERFLPHQRHTPHAQAPILLGFDELPSKNNGVLINLAETPTPHPNSFSRILEIVTQNPRQRAICREHFRHYRKCGYDPRRVEL